jgi:structural maintenance of chromosome 4
MDASAIQMNKAFEPPAGTKRLFDLIQIKNEMYKPAFYQALKDTLVCSDIDVATQVNI